MEFMANSESPQPNNTFKLDIPAKTFVKIFVALILAAVLIEISPLILLFFLSMLLALALSPIVDWAVSKKVPQWLAQALMALFLVALVGFIVGFLVPQAIGQIIAILNDLPKYEKDLEESISSVWLRERVHESYVHLPDQFGNIPARVAQIGSATINGVYHLVLFLIMSIYLMIDGDRAYHWLAAFFNKDNQEKLEKTSAEVRPIISAFFMGQLVNCTFVAAYAFTANTILNIPGALLLATIAAFCDIIPVVGFITSLTIATLMGLTVSPGTALTIACLYVGYSLIENYIIVPRVFGHTMKLSKLAVLVSLLVGGALCGIPGMLLVLPIVGSYPVIEKYWLRKYVGDETIAEHERQHKDH